MSRGFSLPELVAVTGIVGLIAALALPRLAAAIDRVEADAAAREIVTALAVARHSAISQGQRVRMRIAADSLRFDRWDGTAWVPDRRWPGPASRRVGLQVTNPDVVYGPTGIGWGASNTTVTLARGSQVETITTSRAGRVKRWR